MQTRKEQENRKEIEQESASIKETNLIHPDRVNSLKIHQTCITIDRENRTGHCVAVGVMVTFILICMPKDTRRTMESSYTTTTQGAVN